MREDSIFISILQTHIRIVGNRWLYKKLAAPVRRIISNLSVVSYEINPRKITEFESVELNLRHLKEAVLSILTPILKAPEAIPTEIVYMCKMLFTLTNKRFPGKGYRALASYLFLRFICPAIGAPETIGVVKFGHLKPIERRSLVFVAKIIQGVANEMPEQNEDYMQRLKEFIEENIQCLREFFDQVLVVRHKRLLKTLRASPVLVRALCFVHHFRSLSHAPCRRSLFSKICLVMPCHASLLTVMRSQTWRTSSRRHQSAVTL